MSKVKGNGVSVFKKTDESDEDFIKRFKKKILRAGIMKEYQSKIFFEKPSTIKRKKRLKAIRMIKNLNS